MELSLASRALKLLLVQMPVHVVSHVARRSKPLVAKLAAIRFFAGVGFQMVFQASLVAHHAPAVPVRTLEALGVQSQRVF